MKIVKISLVFLSILLTVVSCETDKLNIDISEIKVEMNYLPLDKDLFSVDTSKIWDEIYNIDIKYGDFWDLYTHQVIRIGDAKDIEFAELLTQFITDPIIIENFDKSIEIFPDFRIYIDEIEKSFRHYKYYFPEKTIPDIYTFIGGFNHSVITDNSILGIGLDKYYGPDCDFYGQLQIPDYVKEKLDKKNIPNDCMQAWGYMEFEFKDSLEYLVNTMIYEGKILYFVNAMIPELPEYHLNKYSESELEWCLQNEKEMWKYMIENKLLFSTKFDNIIQLTRDAPFTTPFKQESPGRTGIWIGFQIVKSYMNNNHEISLAELMNDNDFQKILNFSKYNP